MKKKNEDEEKIEEPELDETLYQEGQQIVQDYSSEIEKSLKDLEKEENDNEEKMPLKRKRKKLPVFLVLIVIGLSIFVTLIILSLVLTVGEKIFAWNNICGIVFYSLSLALFIGLVLVPLIQIFLIPSYDNSFRLRSHHNNSHDIKKEKLYLKLLKDGKNSERPWNHIKDSVKEDKKEKIQKQLDEWEYTFKHGSEIEQVKAFYQFYKKYLRKEIDKIFVKHANAVLIQTAVSQNGKLDSIIVLKSSLAMMKEFFLYIGLKPSKIKMLKLYVRILSLVVASSQLQNIDLTSLLSGSIIESVKKIPGVNTCINSFGNGITNALFFYRICILTREYLLGKSDNEAKIFLISCLETSKYLIFSLLIDIFAQLGKTFITVNKVVANSIMSLFKGMNKKIKELFTSKKEKDKPQELVTV